MIELDMPTRSHRLEVGHDELARRRAPRKPLRPPDRCGAKPYVDPVQQAHLFADLRLRVGASGAGLPRDSH